MNTSDVIWELFVDGASRGNPGTAGIGFIIKEKKQIIAQQGAFVGELTNNQAEYLALSFALYSCDMLVLARGYQPELLAIKADSLLVIQQLKRIFAIKNAQLKLLHSSIVQQLVPYTYTLTHVLRSYNKEADRLANSGIDTRKKLPPDFLYFLSQQCPSFYQQLALSYDHRKI